jgi:DNA replication protein
MKQFAGFPARMEFTPVPNIFLNSVMPEIDDIAELKTTLYIIKTLYIKKGHIRFVTGGELKGDTSLMKSLKGAGKSPSEALHQALAQAVTRGTLLHLAGERDGVSEDIYFLNTEANRQNVEKIQSGELVLEGMRPREQSPVELEEQPDIFALYEQNIGVLTPMISDELREAVKLYPEAWIRDAIKEAVSLNKRSWRYMARILERWSAEGKGDGTYRRHPTWRADPDKYIKGPYGHLVQR